MCWREKVGLCWQRWCKLASCTVADSGQCNHRSILFSLYPKSFQKNVLYQKYHVPQAFHSWRWAVMPDEQCLSQGHQQHTHLDWCSSTCLLTVQEGQHEGTLCVEWVEFLLCSYYFHVPHFPFYLGCFWHSVKCLASFMHVL